MPSAVVTKPAAKPAHGQAAVPVLPFTRVAHEHTEAIAYDISTPMTTSSQGPYSIEVPATGYLRSVLLLVTATGGAGAAVTTAADGPWNALDSITLTDAGGAPLIEAISGYELYLVNKYGGYAFNPDPALSASYSAVAAASGNFQFILRVPVEVGNGVCALANMNAAQPYRINYRLNPAATVYGATVPTTLPAVRVRAILESWTTPADGTRPPLDGATQLWSKQVYTINANSNTTKLTRVGNVVRNLLLIARDATGARNDAMLPDPVTLAFDQRQQHITPRAVRKHYTTERYGFAPNGGTPDAGVDCIEQTHDFDGHPGFEMHDFWMHTSQASRLELQGSYSVAGTLTVLTNDIVIPA